MELFNCDLKFVLLAESFNNRRPTPRSPEKSVARDERDCAAPLFVINALITRQIEDHAPVLSDPSEFLSFQKTNSQGGFEHEHWLRLHRV
jgi:hypothetical protein